MRLGASPFVPRRATRIPRHRTWFCLPSVKHHARRFQHLNIGKAISLKANPHDVRPMAQLRSIFAFVVSERASKPSAQKPARSRAVQLLVLCGLLLASAIWAGTSFIVASLHNGVLADNERELRNLALVLAEQTDRTFQALEVVQTSLIERSQALGVASSEDYRREMSGHDIHVLLKDKIQSMPHVDVVGLIDAEGKLINFSRYWPIPELDASDRDYFKALKSDPQRASFVSE